MPSSPDNSPHHSRLNPTSWVAAYGDYLYRYALVRLRSEVLAQDAVQETFLAALKAQETYEGRSSEKTWLVGILKHKIIDIFRKQSRDMAEHDTVLPFEREELFLGEESEWAGHWKKQSSPIDWGDTPLNALEQEDFHRVFRSCFEKLPQRVALAFQMKEIDDSEATEICTVLEISEANLWVMLHRARMHLRRCLEVRWFARHT
ncbi:MAG: sigma-70 family RNA polymerase sigma factor [Candidatus Kapabacteria bacterium]|nr:sigma-70 family RNA polymerase sigma factor [Candidatus Kapabacteria bacterium]